MDSCREATASMMRARRHSFTRMGGTSPKAICNQFPLSSHDILKRNKKMVKIRCQDLQDLPLRVTFGTKIT
jgi:hypothetical protein